MSLKQGLAYLIEQARQRGYRPQYDQKTIIIPIFSFINQLISSLKGFLNSRQYDCWYAYFLDQHLYDRSLANMIKSWQRLKETSLECQLLQSLLTVRNRNKLRLYLKTRKYIIQTATENAMLDEVLLDLQDSITIIHKIFTIEEIKKALVKGINNIFLAFKISQAKLYSSVLIEYLLAVYDSIIKIESDEATISGQFTTNKSMNPSYNENYQSLFSSISNFQSTIHNSNGLYKKSNFGHSHESQKKYQIIQKKFIPLKQTSQYISNANSNKFSTASKHKPQHQREKSLFYEFISHKTDHDKTVSREENDIKMGLNNFSRSYQETSFEKQQNFYRKLYMQQPSRNKSSSRSPQRKIQISQQRRPVFPQNVSRFIKKQPQIQQIQSQSTKNFSLGWFSNKMFETQNENNLQGRQSLLRKQRAKIIKKAEQKRKQSTEKYEIENHIMKMSSLKLNSSKGQKQYEAESDKSEQFEKMVSKNQQFKEKMLKKSHIEMVSESEDYLQKERRNSRCRIFVNMDQQNEGVIQFTSNFGTGDNRETSIHMRRESYSPQKDVSSESLRLMKRRNERMLSYLNNGDEQRQNDSSQDQEDGSKETYSLKRRSEVKVEKIPQFVERPQIIHKSIGEKKMSHFSKYSNSQMEEVAQKNIQQGKQLVNERNSYKMGNMKSLLRVIDDYRQNVLQNDLQQKGLQISESFCKKSKFYSGEQMESVQDHSYQEA